MKVPDGMVVVKDFAARPAWIRWTWGWWMTAREVRAYHVLQGVSAVPCFLGRVDRFAFALEYRPGQPLTRSLAAEVPASFVDDLRRAVAEMHARGVVHLDLRHRSNLLAGSDGRPVLLDFASAIRLSPTGPVGRWLLGWLARIDHAALRKWEVRLTPRKREV